MREVKRPVFSFRLNLDNPDHKKAWEILQSVPDGQKSSYLVQVILKDQENNQLENKSSVTCTATVLKSAMFVFSPFLVMCSSITVLRSVVYRKKKGEQTHGDEKHMRKDPGRLT